MSGPASTAALGERVVLLVDDEEEVRELCGQALARRGWAVLAACSGEEALALAPGGAGIDIVVSDVAMPGMDGPALIRLLRTWRPRLPAIVASGYIGQPLRSDISDEPVHVLAKPYTLKQLVALMEQAMATEKPA